MTRIQPDHAPVVETVEVAQRAADDAGLRYVSDDAPGLTRRRRGNAFSYYTAEGKRVTDANVIRRIKGLVIPPAWTDVWICTDPRGHIQATGRDAAGRKQYRYHARWRTVRDQHKYDRMLAFGRSLPRIRRRVSRDLQRRELAFEKVVATVVELLDLTGDRVGNDEYLKANGSRGLTTLHNRHVRIKAGSIRFIYVGKSKVRRDFTLSNRRLANILRQCQEIPGHNLFQFLDEEGQPHVVRSDDINAYLQAIAGEPFTAKDFRIWKGSVQALVILAGMPHDNGADGQHNVVAAVKQVAECLGNRPATCRKYYIHPHVIDCYLTGKLAPGSVAPGSITSANGGPTLYDGRGCGLGSAEKALLKLLKPASRRRDRR